MFITVIKIYHFFLLNAQYLSLQNSHFSTFHRILLGVKIMGSGNINYTVCLLFASSQIKFNLSFSGLLTVMVKPIRNAYLGTVKHDWTSIVCQ